MDEELNQPETEVEETQETVSDTGDKTVEETPVKTPKDVLSEVLGKEFTSDEDALKAVEGLKKLVGDQRVAEDRKKAQEFEKMKKDPEYRKMFEEIESIKFSQKYPDAVDMLEEVRAIAQTKNVSFTEAFEKSNLSKLYQYKKEVEADKKETLDSVPDTKNKINSKNRDDIDQKLAEAEKSKDYNSILKLSLQRQGFFNEE